LRLQASEDISVRSRADQKFNGIDVNSRAYIYGRNIGNVLVWAVIVILVLPPVVGWASDQQSIVRGRELYLRYCAACHGKDADGRGPVAEDLKASPSDLRYLGERYGMPLPVGTIARFIDGRQDIAAHGPRTMPVWGRRFYDIWTTHQAGEEDFQSQIREIVSYLNAIQQVPRPSASPHSPVTSR
jgi:mono/diheme cytochrome c family protein